MRENLLGASVGPRADALTLPPREQELPPSPRQILWRVVREHLAFGVVLLVAFGLRLVLLREATIWFDEGVSVWAARLSLARMVQWTAGDTHPPLYFALLHFWRLWAGDGEFSVRFLSVVFGTASVAVLWKLARTLLPDVPGVAIIAAALLASARFSVWWSQETRMYALAGLLAALNLLFATRLSQRYTTRDAIGYVLATAAGFWTLYLLALLPIVDGLYWLARAVAEPTWRQRVTYFGRLAALAILAVVSFVPWLIFMLSHLKSWSAQTTTGGPIFFANLYATLLTLGISTNLNRYVLPTLALLGLTIAGLTLTLLPGRRVWLRGGMLLLASAVLLPMLLVWLLVVVPHSIGYVPPLEARYLMPYAAAYDLLAAAALGALGRLGGRWWLPVTALLVAAVIAVQGWSLSDYYGQRYREDDYPSLVATLNAYSHPNDEVLLHTDLDWPMFAYHRNGPFLVVSAIQPITPRSVDRQLQPTWSIHDGLWLVENEDALRADPHHLYEQWLAKRAVASYSWQFGSKQLILYARTPQRAASLLAFGPFFHPAAPQHALSAGGLTLVGWEEALDRYRAGQVANLAVDVDRRGAGGTLVVQLGDPALAKIQTAIPAGNGIVRLPLSLPIPLDATSRDQTWSATLNGQTASEGRVAVLAVPQPATALTTTASPPRVTTRVTFGTAPTVELRGYTIGGSRQPGGTLSLTLYWQATGPTSKSYKVFTHVLKNRSLVVGQNDDFPAHNTLPTLFWQAGQTIVDEHPIPLPKDLAAGDYQIEVGMYDPISGARLGPVITPDGVHQADNRVILATISLGGKP